MRIAFLVHIFSRAVRDLHPESGSGLIDAGHEVDVYAKSVGTSSVVPADADRYELLERTHYWNLPGNYLLRGIRLAGLRHTSGGRRVALGLSLLYASVRLL